MLADVPWNSCGACVVCVDMAARRREKDDDASVDLTVYNAHS